MIRCAPAGLLLGLLCIRPGRADAAPPAPLTERPPPKEPAAEAEVGGLITDGDERRLEELLQQPVTRWATFRLVAPLSLPSLEAKARLEVTTFLTGVALFDGRFDDGSHLYFRARRDRLPFDFQSRTSPELVPMDEETLNSLELTHEQVTLLYDRSLGGHGGTLDLDLTFDRISGDEPTIAAGFTGETPLDLAFTYPAYMDRTDWWLRFGGGYAVDIGPLRGRVDAHLELAELSSRFFARDVQGGVPAGGLEITQKEARESLEVGLQVATSSPGALLVGGMYRFRWTNAKPSDDRIFDSTVGADGTLTSEEIDLEVFEHRGAIGAVFAPSTPLYLSARLEARSLDITGDATERRDVATLQFTRADSRFDPWMIELSAEARYGLFSFLALELDGRAGFLEGDDRWQQVFLLADRDTRSGLVARALDRERILGDAEARAVFQLSWLSFAVGGSFKHRGDREGVIELVDFDLLGDRDRNIGTVFIDLRGRFGRHVRAHARASYFRDELDLEASSSTHDGIEAALEIRGGLDWLAFFAIGGFTDDRYGLSPLEETALLPGFAPVEFDGRSYAGAVGATAAVEDWASFSGIYSVVINAADLDSELQDASFSGAFTLPWKLHLSLTGRYLRFRNGLMPWDDGDAFLGLAGLGASF